jgi:hypothetical protein
LFSQRNLKSFSIFIVYSKNVKSLWKTKKIEFETNPLITLHNQTKNNPITNQNEQQQDPLLQGVLRFGKARHQTLGERPQWEGLLPDASRVEVPPL